MKVTQVAIRPTQASDGAGRPALTPELLAASGARYSRNNEGLEDILSKIDPANPDKSVDGIFRMIDYGHQSIADMVPVAMFIDDVSLFLAYYIWSICPTASGQESSTRYLSYNKKLAIDPVALGIPKEQRNTWNNFIERCYESYGEALQFWKNVAAENPALTRIPKVLLEDASEKARKKVARMKRNFAFDRARYFLPVAAPTNLMLVMSARAWTHLIQHLLSHYLLEAQTLGKILRDELGLAAPQMLRHATHKSSIAQGIAEELLDMRQLAEQWNDDIDNVAHPATAFMEVNEPAERYSSVNADLRFHDNRYAWIGKGLKRTVVRFGWQAVAMAELRDLNRHRTGNKWCPLVPRGFYGAEDQLSADFQQHTLVDLGRFGRDATCAARDLLKTGENTSIYHTMLGTQYYFEHVTTADHFIYEAELRTGSGAHYRYAKHLHDALLEWYERFPETQGLILEGSEEPE